MRPSDVIFGIVGFAVILLLIAVFGYLLWLLWKDPEGKLVFWPLLTTLLLAAFYMLAIFLEGWGL